MKHIFAHVKYDLEKLLELNTHAGANPELKLCELLAIPERQHSGTEITSSKALTGTQLTGPDRGGSREIREEQCDGCNAWLAKAG